MLIKSSTTKKLRSLGIEIIGETTWGTHFCNFFETKQDLLDTLVPFFRTGLESNEYCVCITGDPINDEDALDSLRAEIPDFDLYLSKKCIEILPHTDWFLKNGKFDAEEVFKKWDEKLKYALSLGFEGLRINSSSSWLERDIWDNFIDYERELNNHIRNKCIIVLCTYPLHKCIATDILDVAHVHKAAVSKRHGRWEIIETPETRISKAHIIRKNDRLESSIAKKTTELVLADLDLKNEIIEHTVTEEALQKSEANLRSIFENIGIGLLLLDTNMNIILFNEIARNLAVQTFGKSYSYGENIISLVKEDRRAEFYENCLKVLGGNNVMFETNYPQFDNSTRWYYTRMFPIKIDDGRNIGICITAEDITARKNDDLEKGKITFDLMHRNKDLEQFSYMVSHNLRAPVANILGFSDMLSQDIYGIDEKKTFIAQITSSAKILDEVIRDLSVILQVKTESYAKKETVKFISLVENIEKILKNTIEKENAVIRTDFSAVEIFKGNRVYLYSIFLNLITNGIKYRQPGVPPVIEISSAVAEGKIILKFKDNGLGIDLTRYGKKVFGLYKRFHAEIEGKGMGLFMVKSQVEILGGNISIESGVNKGTTFTIELNQ